jgi:DNA polymerase-3 subunit epsilon
MVWNWLRHRSAPAIQDSVKAPIESEIDTPSSAPKTLPESIVAVDIETTGIHSNDRIVSLGAIWLSTATLAENSFPVSYIHLIFDPLRKSHPEAERVHGYDDWILRHQEPFWEYAKAIRRFLYSGQLIISHNAEFDLGFINREMEIAGEAARIKRPTFCTMLESRRRYGSPANLTAACERIGLRREGRLHGALEDAWLAMMVYLHLEGYQCHQPFSSIGSNLSIFNMLDCPPRPPELPRRNNKTKAGQKRSTKSF